jgi:Leucine-rich repeat (LRR) protein
MIDVPKKIREEIEKCQYSGMIHLSNCRLSLFPSKILSLSSLSSSSSSSLDFQSLRRLDLSFNYLIEIPSSISELTELREIWLQHNPIQTLPSSLSLCSKLEVIDIKGTKVSNLPSELANLKKLYELDYRETPFAQYVLERYEIQTTGLTGLTNLKRVFQDQYERQCLKAAIVEKLLGDLYLKESDNPESLSIVQNMVEVGPFHLTLSHIPSNSILNSQI